MVDVDNSGKIEADEFMLMLSTSSMTAQAESDGQKPDVPVMKHLFGQKLDQPLSFAKFNGFISNLHHEVLRLEFSLYNPKDGVISAESFAKSIVVHASPVLRDGFMSRVKAISTMPKYAEKTVEFEDFQNFNRVAMHATDMREAITKWSNDNKFTKTTFSQAAYAVTGIHLEPIYVDLVFDVFDGENSGGIDSAVFSQVLSNRSTLALDQVHGLNVDQLFTCCKSCVTNWYRGDTQA